MNSDTLWAAVLAAPDLAERERRSAAYVDHVLHRHRRMTMRSYCRKCGQVSGHWPGCFGGPRTPIPDRPEPEATPDYRATTPAGLDIEDAVAEAERLARPGCHWDEGRACTGAADCEFAELERRLVPFHCARLDDVDRAKRRNLLRDLAADGGGPASPKLT